MDFFATLPSPLPLFIALEIASFDTLECLIKASRAAKGLFDVHGGEIMDAIALRTLDTELRKTLRLLVSCMTEAIPRTTTNFQFISAYIISTDNDDGGRPMFKDIPSPTLRAILAIAANTERLVPHVLDELLRRVSVLCPVKLHVSSNSPPMDYIGAPATWDQTDVVAGSLPEWARDPSELAKATGHREPLGQAASSLRPSWAEAYRVKRSILQLELYVWVRMHMPWVGWHFITNPEPHLLYVFNSDRSAIRAAGQRCSDASERVDPGRA
ncbi:hypothetical protein B0T17DRAFT_222058 [Bombardia bombarda]|uniref:Uncharacterized protein n=1 Tax=Bombardia bombarda TaxID=252184 RepID=A0AA39XC15_9PEZI|nr:hypothetical protein B0T17DRAFT_222058 [Bombardia bombarda]